MNFLHLLTTLPPLLAYLVTFAILVAESGLLIGFFLPGDTLVFPLGLLAAQGILSLPIILLVCIAGAVLGDSLGYRIGRTLGPRVFKHQESLFFKKEYVERAQAFYAKYGKGALVLARFTPVVRTFAPTMAGVAQMDYLVFLTYNVLGGVLWSVGLVLLGYFLGKVIPNIDHYLLPIIALILVVSLVAPIKHILEARKGKA